MAATIADCPHCNGLHMGFSFLSQMRFGGSDNRWLGVFYCNRCQGGIICEYRNAQVKFGDLNTVPGEPTQHGFQLLKIYPQAAPLKLPPHTPTPLDRYYQQASDGLRRGDYDASGAMSRKVVDVSTKMLLGDEAKKYNNIQGCIDAVATKGIITRDLKEWAHQIRLGGNEAAHAEAPYEKEEAEDLLSFTELYLTYVYTLPGQLAARKERKAGVAGAPGTVTTS